MSVPQSEKPHESVLSDMALKATGAAIVGGALFVVATGGTGLVPIATACALGAASSIGEDGFIRGAKAVAHAVNEHVLHHGRSEEMTSVSQQDISPTIAASVTPKQETPLQENTRSAITARPDSTPSHSNHVAALQSGKGTGAAITR